LTIFILKGILYLKKDTIYRKIDLKIKKSEVIVFIPILHHLFGGFYNTYFYNNYQIAYWFSRFLLNLVLLLVGILLLRKTYNFSFSDMGFSLSRKYISPLVFVVSCVALVTFWLFFPIFYFNNIHHIITTFLPVNYFKISRDFLFPPYIPRWVFAFYVAVVGGFFEEVYYRGLIFKLLSDRNVKISIIVIVSSCLFTAVHWPAGIQYMPLNFFISIVLAIFYAKFRTVWPLIFGHFAADLIPLLRGS